MVAQPVILFAAGEYRTSSSALFELTVLQHVVSLHSATSHVRALHASGLDHPERLGDGRDARRLRRRSEPKGREVDDDGASPVYLQRWHDGSPPRWSRRGAGRTAGAGRWAPPRTPPPPRADDEPQYSPAAKRVTGWITMSVR